MTHHASILFWDLLPLDQNPAFFLWLDFEEFSIWTSALNFVFGVNVEKPQAHLSGQLTLRHYLKVCLSPFEELLADLDYLKTILVVHYRLHPFIFKHSISIASICQKS